MQDSDFPQDDETGVPKSTEHNRWEYPRTIRYCTVLFTPYGIRIGLGISMLRSLRCYSIHSERTILFYIEYYWPYSVMKPRKSVWDGRKFLFPFDTNFLDRCLGGTSNIRGKVLLSRCTKTQQQDTRTKTAEKPARGYRSFLYEETITYTIQNLIQKRWLASIANFRAIGSNLIPQRFAEAIASLRRREDAGGLCRRRWIW